MNTHQQDMQQAKVKLRAGIVALQEALAALETAAWMSPKPTSDGRPMWREAVYDAWNHSTIAADYVIRAAQRSRT